MFFIFVPAFCAFECGNEWTLLHRYVSMCNAFHLIYCPMIYSHEIKPSGKKINRPTIRVLICIKLLYPTTITITKYDSYFSKVAEKHLLCQHTEAMNINYTTI